LSARRTGRHLHCGVPWVIGEEHKPHEDEAK
jgi:hypothetical protein